MQNKNKNIGINTTYVYILGDVIVNNVNQIRET